MGVELTEMIFTRQIARNLVTKNELKKIISTNSALIIDVRSPDELKNEGKINAKSFVNLPLDKIDVAFKTMDDEAFRKKYQIEKPSFDQNIVVYCTAGNRSEKAKAKLDSFGYKNVENYAGGYMDWIFYIVNKFESKM